MILALLDLSAAVLIVALMNTNTADFGFHSAAQRWSLFRRVLYVLVALALFSHGVSHLEHSSSLEQPEDRLYVISQLAIIVYIVIFPLLRVTGKISQDRWLP